ncbi:uncharacterized protein LOC107361759 [Tetranychus urticae]|uniref:uncharacterized protein LOC107361759 n=1 Tax=Tetranychus urticae TaxID=32264 RepID=UPI00077C07F5|nr:uncharacterized protein LOC107361759 [Tetranychus urticae]
MCSMKHYGGSYRDDSSFYRSLAEKISENLLYYVDGKPNFHKNDNGCTNSDHVNDVKFSAESIVPKLNLEDYNFPPDYQLNDDEELDKIHFLMDELEYLSSSTKTITPPDNMSMAVENDKLPTWPNMKPGSQAFLCNACGKYFTSLRDFDEHEINNHPNVFCSFTEVQLDQCIPANLLMWHHFSPTGLLRSCKVPQIASSSSEPSIRCTKCHNKFTTAAELYQHIIDCSSTTISPFSSAVTPTKNSKIYNLPVQSNPAFSSSALSVTVSSASPSSISTSISSPSSISSSLSSSPSSNSKAVPSFLSTSALSLGSSKLIPQSSTSISPISPARKGNSTRTVNNNFSSPSFLNYNTRSSNKRKPQEPENTTKRRKIARKLKNRDTSIDDTKSEEKSAIQPAPNQDCTKTDTDVSNVNYTPVHRVVRRFAMLNRRIRRRARYFCLNCPAVFSHHLTFAKHRNSCLPPEETDNPEVKTMNDPSDSASRSAEKNLSNKQIGKLKHRIGAQKNEIKRKQKVPTKIVTRRASRQLKTGRNKEEDPEGGVDLNVGEPNTKPNAALSATRVTARKIVIKLRGKAGLKLKRGRAQVNRLGESESNAILSNHNSDAEKTCRALKSGRRRKIIIKRRRRKQQSFTENGPASSSTSTLHNPHPKEPIKHRVILSRRERRCPNCLRLFKYMGNFRKHVQAGCSGNVSQQVNTANEKQSSSNVKNSKDQVQFDESSSLNMHEEQSPASDTSSCSASDQVGRYLSRQKSSVKTSDKKNGKKVDLWKVKQDYPQYAFKGSPAQFHLCPHCKRGFTYLANFRRHTANQCPVKRKGDAEKLSVAGTSANNSDQTSKEWGC